MDSLDAGNRALCAPAGIAGRVPGARSTFYMCERSFTDPRFPEISARCRSLRARATSPEPAALPTARKHGKLER